MEQYINSIKITNNIADEEVLSIKASISKGMMYFKVINASKSYSSQLYEKLKSAFLFNSLKFPYGKITINISTNVKNTSILDLPIAISLLKTQGIVSKTSSSLIVGEIGIDGKICKIDNPYRILRFAIDNNFKNLIIPKLNEDISKYQKFINIVEVETLKDVIQYFRIGKRPIIHHEIYEQHTNLDINDVEDQKQLIRALTIAITGKHNILIKGPIGSGKSISIESLKSILPKLNDNEYLIYNDLALRYNSENDISKTSNLIYAPLSITNREFYGTNTKIGMISQLNFSYLVLDELNLYKKSFIENIKMIMDNSENSKFNKKKYLQYPVNYSVIAIMNPCPCGNLGTNNKCTCTQAEISRHNKLDKSFLDRFSIKIILHHPKVINKNKNNYDISTINTSIERVKELQYSRFNDEEVNNGNIKIKNIEEYLNFDSELLGILNAEINKNKYSRRTVENILKVSRTIADLSSCNHIEFQHLVEAINYQKI